MPVLLVSALQVVFIHFLCVLRVSAPLRETKMLDVQRSQMIPGLAKLRCSPHAMTVGGVAPTYVRGCRTGHYGSVHYRPYSFISSTHSAPLRPCVRPRCWMPNEAA